jgi:large subunit ribosomal protein L25
LLSDVEISCLPANLPEFIEVDVSNLGLDQLLHLSELKLPKGVELVALSHGRDLPVANLHMPRAEVEEVAPAAAEAPAEGAAAAPTEAKAGGEAKKEEKKEDKK